MQNLRKAFALFPAFDYTRKVKIVAQHLCCAPCFLGAMILLRRNSSGEKTASLTN